MIDIKKIDIKIIIKSALATKFVLILFFCLFSSNSNAFSQEFPNYLYLYPFPDSSQAQSLETSIDSSQYGTEIAFSDKSEVLLMERAGAEQDTSTHKNTISIRETSTRDEYLVCLKLQDYDINLKIEVYNLIAKKVMQVYYGPAIKNQECPDDYKIKAYNLPNGVYICIVQGKNLKLSEKFVISR
jgi:hypothetical protein